MIDNIYEIIDDIIEKENINKNLRFLIIGDLLFSLLINNNYDPYESIFKISRNEYLKRIRLRSLINTTFDLDYYKCILIHQKILIGLRTKGITSRSIVRVQTNGNWETNIYITIKLNKSLSINRWFIGLSSKEFIIKSILSSNYSIGSFRNIWKVKRKKREMRDFDISYNSVIKAGQIGFKISSKLFNLNKEIVLGEKNEILENVKCKNFEEYMNKLRKTLIKNKADEYNELVKFYQKILSIEILIKILMDSTIYLPCFMDNRGRQYYATLISPTFYILFRYMYEFSNKKEFINLEDSKFYRKIIAYKNLVDEFKLDNFESYLIIVLFIEVGKFYIKKEKEYMIKTEKIIKYGIEKYKEKNIDLDLYDIMYIKKIYSEIDNIINKNMIDKNMIVFKDATASGLQNYGIMLGYKEEKLKYINIDNEDSYCDTYRYLIDIFLEDNTGKLYKREYWKSTIMTIPYNSVWYSCFNKFIEKIRKDGIEYNKMNIEEKENIKKIHKDFYNKIKNKIKDELYEDKIKKISKFEYDKWEKIKVDEYKVNYKKARDKYTNVLYMLIEDPKTSETALEANNMHYLDALLVKEILKNFEVLTVHDDFGIRLCELHLVMDEINKYYSKHVKKETYSIHVIV